MAGNEAMNGWRGGGGGIRSTATEAIAAIAERTRVSERKTSEIESERERERAEVKKSWVGRAGLPVTDACVTCCSDVGTSSVGVARPLILAVHLFLTLSSAAT